MTEQSETPENTGIKVDTRFKPGFDPRRNLDGRPDGSKNKVSVIGTIERMFEDDPEMFLNFVDKYLKDPRNRQHIVEMIDGKPRGSTSDTNVNIVIPILGGNSVPINAGNAEVAEINKEN